jgi:hypothetical protein
VLLDGYFFAFAFIMLERRINPWTEWHRIELGERVCGKGTLEGVTGCTVVPDLQGWLNYCMYSVREGWGDRCARLSGARYRDDERNMNLPLPL